MQEIITNASSGQVIIRNFTPIEIVEYESRITPPEIPTLEFDQMLIGFVTEGWITQAEGESWLNGVLPLSVTTRIATLPVALQFKATARAKRQSTISRNDELLVALGQLKNKTPAQIDAFFITYSKV